MIASSGFVLGLGLDVFEIMDARAQARPTNVHSPWEPW